MKVGIGELTELSHREVVLLRASVLFFIALAAEPSGYTSYLLTAASVRELPNAARCRF